MGIFMKMPLLYVFKFVKFTIRAVQMKCSDKRIRASDIRHSQIPALITQEMPTKLPYQVPIKTIHIIKFAYNDKLRPE